MGGDRTGQDGNVVTPLEQAHDAALGVVSATDDNFAGEHLKIVNLETKITNRVLGMGIEAGADQDQFRPDAAGNLLKTGSECRVILPVRGVP